MCVFITSTCAVCLCAHALAKVAGIRFVFDPHRPPGHRVLAGVTVNGAPLELDRLYTLATKAYLTEGRVRPVAHAGRPALTP